MKHSLFRILKGLQAILNRGGITTLGTFYLNFTNFLTWRKTAIYTGFPNYIHTFICVKSLYRLQCKGLKVVVFLYMDMYMQCVYSFVRGYADECGMWFWFYISIIKFNFINHTIRFYKPYNMIIKTIFHIHSHIHAQMYKHIAYTYPYTKTQSPSIPCPASDTAILHK